MTPEQIEKWAREADVPWRCRRTMQTALYHFARLARADAFEEAAKLCAQVAPKYPLVGHQYVCGSNDAKYDCIDAIRALAAAEKEPAK